jgi:putative ABC transport system substrate-binding protein
MRRREFITLLGGAAVAWPVPVGAQQEGKNRKVGVLHPGRGAGLDARVTAINEGLNDPSQRFRTELVISLAYGELSRLPALAADLVKDRVHAMLAVGPPAVQAAKDATAEIPVIAIDLESDPVASGWIESLAHPRGNLTGVFLDFPDFAAKCLQPLKETTPSLSGIGVLWDPTTGSLQLAAVQAAARGMGIDIMVFEARRAADIARRIPCAGPRAYTGCVGAFIAAVRRQPATGRRHRCPKKSADYFALTGYRQRGWAARLRA